MTKKVGGSRDGDGGDDVNPTVAEEAEVETFSIRPCRVEPTEAGGTCQGALAPGVGSF